MGSPCWALQSPLPHTGEDSAFKAPAADGLLLSCASCAPAPAVLVHGPQAFLCLPFLLSFILLSNFLLFMSLVKSRFIYFRVVSLSQPSLANLISAWHEVFVKAFFISLMPLARMNSPCFSDTSTFPGSLNWFSVVLCGSSLFPVYPLLLNPQSSSLWSPIGCSFIFSAFFCTTGTTIDCLSVRVPVQIFLLSFLHLWLLRREVGF